MKKFITKSIVFILLGVFFIEAFISVYCVSQLYLLNYPGKEIYYSIKKSKKKNNSKILLLGDSVANQIISNKSNSDCINSLTCNQSIGLVGQFLLLNNYLISGNRIDKVVLLMHPFSFGNNLDQVYTYHYFLKPFNKSEYSIFFTPKVKEQIEKIPYYKFSQIPHVLVGTWAPKYISKDIHNFTFLAPISIEYLDKIHFLSKKFSFKLELLATPVSEEYRQVISEMDINEVKQCGLEIEFKKYFESIIYLDKEEFSDGTHLIKPDRFEDLFKNKIQTKN